jgi:DNA-binding MarR family transcriptional regulator
MDSPWTTHTLAAELLELLPLLGRTFSHHARAMGSEKTTLQQGRVLALLIDHPLTVSGLAKKRGVSLQAASSLVQGLVERGWVTRTPDLSDRRQLLLEVTPDGLVHARLVREQMVDHLAEFLEGLSPEEINAAREFLPALKHLLMEHASADSIPAAPPDETTDG